MSDNEYTEPNTSKLAVLVVVSSVESLFSSDELLVSDDLFESSFDLVVVTVFLLKLLYQMVLPHPHSLSCMLLL